MTTFRAASHGVGWMLGAQLVVSGGQFLYSGVTARLFTPTEFGGFAAALSLQGLLILLTTTGLPSIVLKERTLSRTDLVSVRVYAAVGGLLAATLFFFLSPLWLALLNAPSGQQYIGLLTIALALGPMAAIESALLRKEERPIADSITIIMAFVVPAAVAVIVALTVREAWAIALTTALGPLVLFSAATTARKVGHQAPGPQRHRELLGFASKLSTQNVVFLVVGQAPGWLVSAVLGAGSLGQYSRANTLAGMPSTALSTALNRAIQPHWWKLEEVETTKRAIRDTAILAGSVSFPIFAVLAAVGPDLSVLWLGPGWESASLLVPWLAISFGLQVPFTILANSLEMRGLFRPVRFAQLGLVAGLGIGFLAFFATRDVRVAAMATVLSQLVGLIVLVGTMAKSSFLASRTLYSALGLPFAWALVVGCFAVLGSKSAEALGWTILSSPETASVLSGGFLGACAWALTFRWQPASRTLTERGVPLPSMMRKSMRS